MIREKPRFFTGNRLLKSLEDFSRTSSAHGLKYIIHPRISFNQRFFWFVMILIHACLACLIGTSLWYKFANAPIHNVVENTHYPLGNLVFPSVTLCPVNRINRSVGLEILNSYVDNSSDNSSDAAAVESVLTALVVMKYPTYFNMLRHLEASRKYWDVFSQLNITDFLFQTLSSCSEIFEECQWRGEVINCCEYFSLQLTEEGFCYAFNSLTSKECKCPYNDAYDESTGDCSCQPFRTSTTGSFSGLTVILKKETRLSDDFAQDFVTGVKVLIGSPCEHPEAGSGLLLETFSGHTMEIEVTPVLFEPHPAIKRVSVVDRKCLLASEKDLTFYNYYSEHNCLLECRHKYIADNCGCQPSPFFNPNLPHPICNVSSLMCIAQLSAEGKIRKRANMVVNQAGQDFPSCSCWPSCHRLQYDLRVRRNILTVFAGKERYGILDVHYSIFGAIKYQKKLTFSVEELLRGTISLLMGASIINAIELSYYFARGLFRSLVKMVNSVKARAPFTRSREFQM